MPVKKLQLCLLSGKTNEVMSQYVNSHVVSVPLFGQVLYHFTRLSIAYRKRWISIRMKMALFGFMPLLCVHVEEERNMDIRLM